MAITTDIFGPLSLDDLLQTVMREGQSVILGDPTSPLPAAERLARGGAIASLPDRAGAPIGDILARGGGISSLPETAAERVAREPIGDLLARGGAIASLPGPRPMAPNLGVVDPSTPHDPQAPELGVVDPSGWGSFPSVLAEESIASRRPVGDAYTPPAADMAPRQVNAAAAAPAAVTPSPQDLPARSLAQRLRDFGTALQGRDTPDREAQNATYRALTGRGVDPEMARAAIGNTALMQQVLTQAFRPRTQSVAPGNTVIDDQGRVVFRNTENFATIPEGGGVFNRTTGEVVQGGTPRAPAGFEWVDPNDRSKGLRAIPGGPGTHVSAEVAGRLALMNNARRGIARARDVYERAWGTGDFLRQGAANLPLVGDLAIASGDQGEAQRDIRTAVEAALRTMTGAAAPETEVARYTALFTPTARDSIASAKQKLDNLDNFMAEAARLVTQGRTSEPPPSTSQNNDGWRDVAPGIRIREKR